MARAINQKCLDCAKLNRKGYTTRGLLEKLHPECYVLRKCSRKRGYYRDLPFQRARQNKNHRYIKYRGDKCVICKSKEELNTHHIIPQLQGGQDTQENTITVCKRCHRIMENYTHCLQQKGFTITQVER